MKRLLYPGRLTARWELPPLPGDLPNGVMAALPDGSSGYPISTALGTLLGQLVVTRHPRNVLEFGAGSSSVVFAAALAANGKGTLTSLEQSPEWCLEAWQKVKATGIDACLIPAALRFGLTPFPCHRFAMLTKGIEGRGPYDLVLVDAPQYYYGRDGALPLVAHSLALGALIVVDDAGRHEEQWAIRRWLWTYPALSLVGFDPGFGRNGVAVLRWGGEGNRVSVSACLSGAFHSLVGWALRTSRGYKANVP